MKPTKTPKTAAADRTPTASEPLVPEIVFADEIDRPRPSAEHLLTLRRSRARSAIHRYCAMAAGAGLVPIPIVDAAALTTLQLNMVRTLTRIYRVGYDQEHGRAHVGALLSLAIPGTLVFGLKRLVRLIPVVGQVGSILVGPAAAWSSTQAIGKIFVEHFERGGTLFDFEPEEKREALREAYSKAEAPEDAAPADAGSGAETRPAGG